MPKDIQPYNGEKFEKDLADKNTWVSKNTTYREDLIRKFQWRLENEVEGKPVDKSDYGFVAFGAGKEAVLQINMTGIS